MTSFQDSLRSELRNQLCLWLATQENLYRIGSRLVPLLEVGSELYGAGYRLFCNREPPPFTPPEPEFTGGQCPGVQYDIQINYSYTAGGGATINTYVQGTVYGPVYAGGVTITQTGPGTWAMKYYCGQPPGPEFASLGTTGSLATANEIKASATLQVLRRHDYAPDTCGDPPPPPVPDPSPSTNDIDVTYTDEDGDSQTTNINFVFGLAFVDANLNINVPIRLSFNNSFNPSFNATANLTTGDINFNFGNTNIIHPPDGTTIPPDGFSTDGDTPAQPPDTPGDPIIPPNDTQDDETTRILHGVIVTVTDINQNLSEVFQDDNPTIYIPRLGNIQFLIQVGNRIAWTADIPVRNRRHFIPCPWEGGAIDVKGTPVPNVQFSLTKVYKRSQEAVTYVT